MLALALPLLGACGQEPAPPPPPPPNVLLVSLDTCRRDHLSSYGYERRTTPNLDLLAEDGYLFTRAVAVSNWTLPTHASMLTGLYPRSHGAHRLTGVEKASDPASLGKLVGSSLTLAEVLAGEGYRTGAVVSNSSYLQPQLGLSQGFEHYDYRQPGPPLYYRRAEVITDNAIAWLEDVRGEPFFLFLNYMDPHFPYLPPPAYDMRYSGNASLRERYSDWESFRDRIKFFGVDPLTVEEADFFRDQYDAEISYMDAEIGRLLDRLRQRGLYEGTLVVVVSDHGEAFGEHGVVGHGATLYEHQTAVPLIVKTPFGKEATRVDTPVSHVDILPTVLRELGVEIPEAVQGTSVFEKRARDLFAEVHPKKPDNPGHRLALYREDLKYIASAAGRRELFDLGADPGELEDQSAAAEGASTASLEQSLRRWLAETRTVRAVEPMSAFSESDLEALRALGYID